MNKSCTVSNQATNNTNITHVTSNSHKLCQRLNICWKNSCTNKAHWSKQEIKLYEVVLFICLKTKNHKSETAKFLELELVPVNNSDTEDYLTTN